MNGWGGQILRINLSKSSSKVEPLSQHIAQDFIGGRGLATKVLFDELDAEADPLGTENKLIFANGALTGSGAPATSRFMVITKSPLTNCIGCANAGGYFGPRMKFAGYDLLVVEGKAAEPVYLSINDDHVEIKDARQLWGKTTSETEATIRSEINDKLQERKSSIASIGPAGENLVKFACIISDSGRTVGRSGLGAVMGAKNLKAITVSGTKKVKIADNNGFKKAMAQFRDELKDSRKKTVERRNAYGTWELIGKANPLKLMASFNFQKLSFDGFKELENPENIRSKLFVRSQACFGCPYGCSKITRVVQPAEYKGSGKGPEYESLVLLGSNCGIADITAIAKANYLCNDLGVDTITAGATISCAMELYEKGYLSEENAGHRLNFGNSEAMLELIKNIAFRSGFGDALAEGGYRVAKTYGHPELFMGVKGQGMPAWHPQGPGNEVLGLQYATSNHGACHTRCAMPTQGRMDKEKGVYWTVKDQNYMAAADSCGCCWIEYVRPSEQSRVPVWLSLVTGVDYSHEQFLFIGERIWNLERLFNINAGLTAKDDMLPKRMLEGSDGEGKAIQLDKMLAEYYKLRGWDNNGVPTEEKLIQLGLSTRS
jgi:aldehyde:ferredoxin oxidoreductase